MEISKLLSDEAVLGELGERIARFRLEQQLTQTDLAEQAGISKRTLERIEAGASVQMLNMLRVWRVLELLPNLDRMIPQPGPSPLDLLKRKGKQRQRASASRSKKEQSDSGVREQTWSWAEDA
jgi:transcriptional regulator with XRE-family HTH domain